MNYQHPELEIVRAALNRLEKSDEQSVSQQVYGTVYGTPPFGDEIDNCK